MKRYLHYQWGWLAVQFFVLQYFHWSIFQNTATKEDLKKAIHELKMHVLLFWHFIRRSHDSINEDKCWSCWSKLSDLTNQTWIPPVGDIILSNVSMQPVTEVEEAIIQWNQDISNETYSKTKQTTKRRYSDLLPSKT